MHILSESWKFKSWLSYCCNEFGQSQCGGGVVHHLQGKGVEEVCLYVVCAEESVLATANATQFQ